MGHDEDVFGLDDLTCNHVLTRPIGTTGNINILAEIVRSLNVVPAVSFYLVTGQGQYSTTRFACYRDV